MSQFNPFVCPPAATLTAIPSTTCPVKFDQIIASVFRRKSGANPFTASTILTQAAWTAALAATDNTKIIVTPAYSGMSLPESEVTIEGENDNSTVGGYGSVAGGNVIRPKGIFRNKSAAAMKVIRGLTAESSNGGDAQIVQVWINIFGQIICQSNGEGFDTANITVSDVYTEGLKEDNMHALSYSLGYGWSDDYVVLNPSFNVKALLPL